MGCYWEIRQRSAAVHAVAARAKPSKSSNLLHSVELSVPAVFEEGALPRFLPRTSRCLAANISAQRGLVGMPLSMRLAKAESL